MAVHNEAKLGEIAKTVLMPGDPMRAKYIAETFLEDYKLVNNVRGMLAFTGKYKGKEITVMASGMGMPSIGIYSYELYKFYGVENIIRIGSCGGHVDYLKLLDVVLVSGSYTEGNFAKNMTENECHFIEASEYLNEVIEKTAKEINQDYTKGNMACTECFDPYLDDPMSFTNRIPKEYNSMGSEMECFALFYTAKHLGKNAACLLTVSDSLCFKEELTSQQRQLSMNNMIKLALESAIKI
jgi:purine-nucleoside phosphorylase